MLDFNPDEVNDEETNELCVPGAPGWGKLNDGWGNGKAGNPWKPCTCRLYRAKEKNWKFIDESSTF